MKFQVNDRVIYDGRICRVVHENPDWVAIRRESDGHTMVWTTAQLAAEQVPWVMRPKVGWWSQMRDIAEYRALTPDAVV
jgi:hypothetical protein